MTGLRSVFVEVYLFRTRARGARTPRRIEFLCLRRGRVAFLPGVWQPVTGKRRRGETSRVAALREVREETGLAPVRWWALEAPTVYYDAALDRVMALSLFAAEIAPDAQVRLSREHDAWAFLPAREAGRRFLWEAQRRGLEDVRRQVLRGGPLARTLELPLRRPRAAARPRTPRAGYPRAPRADARPRRGTRAPARAAHTHA
ncbi:MAG TPA: NUDIX domain-containing protein, partial [Terriglobales bacterium]|nr:NUDIX domain-containing protein [Terriglobales bacterium]